MGKQAADSAVISVSQDEMCSEERWKQLAGFEAGD